MADLIYVNDQLIMLRMELIDLHNSIAKPRPISKHVLGERIEEMLGRVVVARNLVESMIATGIPCPVPGIPL